jgi:hypothetical protein
MILFFIHFNTLIKSSLIESAKLFFYRLHGIESKLNFSQSIYFDDLFLDHMTKLAQISN